MDAWLKQQLRRREWRQADLAHRMGVSTGTISRWARGVRIPTPASCDRLADVLGVDLDTVLGIAGHRPPDSLYGEHDPRNDVISQLPKLSDDDVVIVLEVVGSLIRHARARRRRQVKDQFGERGESQPLGRAEGALARPSVGGAEGEVATAQGAE